MEAKIWKSGPTEASRLRWCINPGLEAARLECRLTGGTGSYRALSRTLPPSHLLLLWYLACQMLCEDLWFTIRRDRGGPNPRMERSRGGSLCQSEQELT